jgi:hypothetical protein
MRIEASLLACNGVACRDMGGTAPPPNHVSYHQMAGSGREAHWVLGLRQSNGGLRIHKVYGDQS